MLVNLFIKSQSYLSKIIFKIQDKTFSNFKTEIKLLFVFIALFFNMTLFSQLNFGEVPKDKNGKIHTKEEEDAIRKQKKHKDLETELELYPVNLLNFRDPVIKNEAMFDYHLYSKNEKLLGGVRFFGDANTHYEGTREMKDLIMYTSGYFGFKNFQMGAEIGSISSEEYISVGPQFTSYDNLIFKRVSIISRVVPDFILGYEFTTQEAKLFKQVKISGTGMGRMVLPSNETVIQASLWLSFEKLKGAFFGVEYEYNNAKYFNNNKFETNNELFFGVKFELY